MRPAMYSPAIRSWLHRWIKPYRKLTLVITLSAISILGVFVLRGIDTYRGWADDIDEFNRQSTDLNDFTARTRNFWNAAHLDLEQARPQTSAIPEPLGITGVPIQLDDPPPRYETLHLDRQQHKSIQHAHHAYIASLRTRNYSIPYEPRTRGIVTLAGGNYNAPALVSVRALRDTGCALPVEVFVRDRDEYSSSYCDDVFPKLGARCMILADLLGPAIMSHLQGGWDLKAFVMASTSFEQALFLDSDCIPLQDPSRLFKNEPFLSTGLVLWPDFWYRSESPVYFDIANIPMPVIHKKNPTTDSAQLLFSKRTHQDTLLMALYYNYHGPEFYWYLIMQKYMGTGDKETFRAAADIMGQPVHITKHPCVSRADRRKMYGNTWALNTIVQYDPSYDLDGNVTKSLPFFAHHRDPKIDPGAVFSNSTNSFIFDAEGKMQRTWYPDPMFHTQPTTLEMFGHVDKANFFWSSLRDTTCAYSDLFSTDACRLAGEYLAFIERTEPHGSPERVA